MVSMFLLCFSSSPHPPPPPIHTHKQLQKTMKIVQKVKKNIAFLCHYHCVIQTIATYSFLSVAQTGSSVVKKQVVFVVSMILQGLYL